MGERREASIQTYALGTELHCPLCSAASGRLSLRIQGRCPPLKSKWGGNLELNLEASLYTFFTPMDALPMQFETTGDYGGARESHGFLTGTEYTFFPLFCPVAEFETLYELV